MNICLNHSQHLISLLHIRQIKALESLPWYPQGNGYKIGTDRKTIRKLAGLEPLHKWMIKNTDSGNITRQEAVSMVPPLALHAQACHKCLDMCAAPGSKTSQVLLPLLFAGIGASCCTGLFYSESVG